MQKNLPEWEEYLKPFFLRITLLGEIPLTRDQVEEIGVKIQELIQRRKTSSASKKLDAFYPCTFSTYLVHVAAHNTEREYWGVIEANLDVPEQTATNHKWKQNFINTLKKFNLPTFESAGGYRYVTPIRLHAGIPAYSLPDFFEEMLLPSIQKARFAELPTSELVDELLKRSAVQTSVNSSVRYFLEFGQRYAPDYVLEFVENCQKMARFYQKNYDLPNPAELNLPPYVVRAFRKFMEEEQDSKTGQRIRFPFVSLTPWDPEFYLQLPKQLIDGLSATQSHYWNIVSVIKYSPQVSCHAWHGRN